MIKLDTRLDHMTVDERLVREQGVAVITGTTFGLDQGCYLRVAYGALDADTIAEGMGRLVQGLKSIAGG
jgi:aspartate/methionine/tyrosine aminotransferase